MLTELNAIRLAMADSFNIIIFENKFIFFNYWSLWHIFQGFYGLLIINKIFKVKTKSRAFFFTILFLLCWEGVELMFIFSGSDFARLEPIKDIIWDIIFGTLGMWITSLVIFKKKKV